MIARSSCIADGNTPPQIACQPCAWYTSTDTSGRYGVVSLTTPKLSARGDSSKGHLSVTRQPVGNGKGGLSHCSSQTLARRFGQPRSTCSTQEQRAGNPYEPRMSVMIPSTTVTPTSANVARTRNRVWRAVSSAALVALSASTIARLLAFVASSAANAVARFNDVSVDGLTLSVRATLDCLTVTSRMSPSKRSSNWSSYELLMLAPLRSAGDTGAATSTRSGSRQSPCRCRRPSAHP